MCFAFYMEADVQPGYMCAGEGAVRAGDQPRQASRPGLEVSQFITPTSEADP